MRCFGEILVIVMSSELPPLWCPVMVKVWWECICWWRNCSLACDSNYNHPLMITTAISTQMRSFELSSWSSHFTTNRIWKTNAVKYVILKFKQSKQLMHSHILLLPAVLQLWLVTVNSLRSGISLKDLSSNLNKTKNINKNTSFAEA